MATDSRLILVIDDDEDLREMVEMVLSAEGFRVTSAANGAEALERVRSEMPALILLDMLMPVLDGWGFAREFRELHGRAAPLIVLTAGEDSRQRATDVAADDLLAKPFHLEDLLAMVRKWFRT